MRDHAAHLKGKIGSIFYGLGFKAKHGPIFVHTIDVSSRAFRSKHFVLFMV